ncbi:MAG: putative glycoside hydrolase [Leptospiraceae bacterium]|nr:putative glycoside hydrolase [Leptospiraceae bacterium]MDW8306367.1 putative glycoside hydrolase [Leptospiraceae bacterium]
MQQILALLFFLAAVLLYSSMGCIYRQSQLKEEALDAHRPLASIPKPLQDQNTTAVLDTPPEAGQKRELAPMYEPSYRRGIYLHNRNSHNLTKLQEFLKYAQRYSINTFVLDVQPKMVDADKVEFLQRHGIFVVARVVVFPGGLRQKNPDPNYVVKILKTVEDASKSRFQEIQLDYIRYADTPEIQKIPRKHKYETISAILRQAKEITSRYGVLLSADVFGRITLNHDDTIGQRLELFGDYVDVICPMLYPSHYYNDRYRMGHPYETVQEGVANTKNRLKGTRVVAYIQAFSYQIRASGLSLEDYILAQVRAVYDAGGDGFILWNPHNDYERAARGLLYQELSSR